MLRARHASPPIVSAGLTTNPFGLVLEVAFSSRGGPRCRLLEGLRPTLLSGLRRIPGVITDVLGVGLPDPDAGRDHG